MSQEQQSEASFGCLIYLLWIVACLVLVPILSFLFTILIAPFLLLVEYCLKPLFNSDIGDLLSTVVLYVGLVLFIVALYWGLFYLMGF